MILERQGPNLAPKIAALEKRVEMLENMLQALQSEKPRMGRPPKGENEPKRSQVNYSS
jgi:hypothetical protein